MLPLALPNSPLAGCLTLSSWTPPGLGLRPRATGVVDTLCIRLEWPNLLLVLFAARATRITHGPDTRWMSEQTPIHVGVLLLSAPRPCGTAVCRLAHDPAPSVEHVMPTLVPTLSSG